MCADSRRVETTLGQWLNARRRTREGEAIFRQAIDCYRQWHPSSSAHIDIRPDQAKLWFLYGDLLEYCQRPGEAREAFAQAATFHEQLAKDFPGERFWPQQLAIVHHKLGFASHVCGRLADTEQYYRKSLEERQGLATQFPTNLNLQEEKTHALRILALCLPSDRWEEARKWLSQALEICEDLKRRDPLNPIYYALYADTPRRIADTLAAGHRISEAEDAYQTALTRYEQAPTDMLTKHYLRNEWRDCVANYTDVLRKSGRASRADAVERQAWSVLEQRLTDLVRERPNDAGAWLVRGQWYARRQQWERAAGDMTRAVELNPSDTDIWLEYAAVLLLAGKTDDWRKFCCLRLKEAGSLPDGDGPQTPFQIARLCSLQKGACGEPDRIIKLAQSAENLSAAPWYKHGVALAYYSAGQFDESRKCAERLLKDLYWGGKPLNQLVLALACHRLGRFAEARKWLEKTIPAWPEGTRSDLHIHDWLEGEILLREARTTGLLKTIAVPANGKDITHKDANH